METIALEQIRTNRMVIRPLSEEDIPNIFGLMSDFDTASKTGFRPVGSAAEAEGFVRESIREGSACGMTLTEKPWDIFGIILLYPDNEGTGDGAGVRTVTIGYFMREDMRGNGYMPEAVDAVKAYLFNALAVDKLIINLFPENNASRRVAQKCGFSFDEVVTEAGLNGATGKLEDLEYYSLSRTDYFNGKGMNGGYKLDMIVPGRVLSEGCPGVPRLHEFYAGDKCGLKDEIGKVVFEPVWDKIVQWKDADVVYALKGGGYAYFNTKGERILTEVEPLDGVEDTGMPYYVSEEQGRPEMMTFTLADCRSGNRCCYMKGRWIQIGRILREKAGEYLGNGDILPFRREAFDEFKSPFTYIYSAFEAKREGQNDIEGCVEQLRQMGCYDSSWHYLTNVSVSSSATHLVRFPSAVFIPFERYLSPDDMKRISVGVDPELPEGAVRVRQIRYFKDRWPLPEELDYRNSLVNDTCDEMVRKRGVALSKIREVSRLELMNSAVKDFMADRAIPGEMYKSEDWQDTTKKIRRLLSFGYRIDDAIWQVAKAISDSIRLKDGDSGFGCSEQIIRWLCSEGADINYVQGMKAPLDMLTDIPGKLPGIQVLADLMKELGGKTVNEMCKECGDDVGAVLGILYPWAMNNN